MEGKKRKRCSVRLLSKISKAAGVIEGEFKTEEQRRCMEWINSQKKIPKRTRKTIIDRNSTSKYDRSPEPSADSLAGLKKEKPGSSSEQVLHICEWKDCMQEFEGTKDLHDHVGVHIIHLNPIRKKYYCFWDLCHYQTECSKEVTRHIFYHAYHTILKTAGESIAQKVNVPRCTNDSVNRNLIPELKTDFSCYWDDCKESFKSIHYFHLHAREHVSFEKTLIQSRKTKRSKITINCKWNGCNRIFDVAYRLTEHLKKHTNERVVGCYHCGGLFSNNTNFFDHCKRQEVSQEFQCAQCLKYFSSERLLRIHVLVHVNSHKCSICEMTCNSAYQLAKHIRYRHIIDRPFQCSLCKYRSVSKFDLDAHIMYTHKKRPVACNELGCKFIGKSVYFLRKHESEVHTKSIYACHCCKKKYKHGRELSIHLKTIHKYQMLPGHRRFIYRMDENGFYRLQTLRIESLEVTEQMSSPHSVVPGNYERISFHIKELDKNSPGPNAPFKIIATHDSTVEQFNMPDDEFEQKYSVNENSRISSKDVIITFKEIDEDGNVIQSKCISGNEIMN